MGYDRRIGRAFLDAGLGYGGSCFPKDVKALAHMADEAGLHPQLLDAVMKINHDQRHVVIDKLAAELGGLESLRGKRIGVLGLAFKDNTDDMREAPALDIVTWLLEAGAQVRVYDPVAMETAKHLNLGWRAGDCAGPYHCAPRCHGLLVVSGMEEFPRPHLSRLADA